MDKELKVRRLIPSGGTISTGGHGSYYVPRRCFNLSCRLIRNRAAIRELTNSSPTIRSACAASSNVACAMRNLPAVIALKC
jgi:hypothetical protein